MSYFIRSILVVSILFIPLSMAFCGNSPNITINDSPFRDGNGVTLYGHNSGLIPYTVTVRFPVLVNYTPSRELPCRIVIPANTKNVFILTLKKSMEGTSSQYRYTYGTSPGDQTADTVPSRSAFWLFDTSTATTEDSSFQRFDVEDRDMAVNLYAPSEGFETEEFESIDGKEVRNELYRNYGRKLIQTDILTVRVQHLGRTRVFFARNGCVRPQRLKVTFPELKNMEASKTIPHITVVPPLTEVYLFFIRCPNSLAYNYRYSFIYRPQWKRSIH